MSFDQHIEQMRQDAEAKTKAGEAITDGDLNALHEIFSRALTSSSEVTNENLRLIVRVLYEHHQNSGAIQHWLEDVTSFYSHFNK